MKLNSEGVTISILILVIMMLICHTMNYLYPKNRFMNVPQTTNYNEIYYSNQDNKLCNTILTSTQADIPCNVIKSCADTPNSNSSSTSKPPISTKPKTKLSLDNLSLYNLSNSEIAVIYKTAYNEAAREIFMRTIEERSPKPTQSMRTSTPTMITTTPTMTENF